MNTNILLIAGMEVRTLVKDLSIRARKDGEKTEIRGIPVIGTLEGYAAKFNSPSRDFGGFKEVLHPRCFQRSLACTDDMHDVRALVGHDKNRILARRSANTLEINEDNIGLRVAMHLIDTNEGRDTLLNIRSGNLDAMSFGFKPFAKPEWVGGSGNMVRGLKDVDLYEVSVVSWAQYEDTEISARALMTRECPLVGSQVDFLRRKMAVYELDIRAYGDQSTESTYERQTSDASYASQRAAEATRAARTSPDDNDVAMKAHKKVMDAHTAAAKSAPDFHKGVAEEHRAMMEFHKDKCC